MIEAVVTAIWLMLPAYIANSAAVVTGGGPSIDMGKEMWGTRILGDGKTWRGFVGGVFFGFVLAQIMNAVLPTVEALLAFELFAFPLVVALTLPAGALLGDMIASFVKRRLGRERGAPFPGVDQLDFLVGSLGLTTVMASEWLVVVLSPAVFVVIVVLTPLLHVSANIIGYHLGLKDEPW